MAVRADADYGVPAEPNWRTIDWPPHLHDVEFGGRSLRYVDIGGGHGPPVVLIHGIASCWQMWLETIPSLALHRRVVGIDLPGFGGSEMPAEQISMTLFANTVEALCERLELGPVAVFGHSMGGYTGAELALRHPDRVERLALVGAAGLTIARTHLEPTRTILAAMIATTPSNPRLRARALSRPAFRHAANNWLVRHPLRIAPDLLMEQAERFPRPGILPAWSAMTNYDYRDRLGEVACPTLVIHGRNDVLVPVSDADEYGRLIPDARVVILDDTGHAPMLERPQRFNEELLRFIGVAVPDGLRQPERVASGNGAAPNVSL
jgi:pimeloyl-ACP methyl ester carboxylesterase